MMYSLGAAGTGCSPPVELVKISEKPRSWYLTNSPFSSGHPGNLKLYVPCKWVQVLRGGQGERDPYSDGLQLGKARGRCPAGR